MRRSHAWGKKSKNTGLITLEYVNTVIKERKREIHNGMKEATCVPNRLSKLGLKGYGAYDASVIGRGLGDDAENKRRITNRKVQHRRIQQGGLHDTIVASKAGGTYTNIAGNRERFLYISKKQQIKI